jgi:hypothetical protein
MALTRSSKPSLRARVGEAAERLAAAPPPSAKRSDPAPGPGRLRHSDFKWGLAFVVPYAAAIFAFAVHPLGRALWIAGEPSLYPEVIADPLYLPTAGERGA